MKQTVKYILLVSLTLLLFACGQSDKPGSPEYTVTLNYNNGSPTESHKVKEGETFILPSDEPNRADCYFMGWLSGDGIYDPGESYEVWEDILFEAQWYELSDFTVTFDYDNGSPRQTITVKEDTEITLPPEPTKTGYYFMWWSDGVDDFEADELYMIQDNMTFTAIWEIETFEILFDADGGVIPNTGGLDNVSIIYNYGDRLDSKAPAPVKNGVSNVEWVEWIDENTAVIRDGALIVTDGMWLYAKYLKGFGTDAEPYIITDDPKTLAMIDSDSEASYLLSADITLTDDWSPFYFAGKLDGNGHKIEGLQIPAGAGATDAGLFNFVENSIISNLTVATSSVGVNGTGSVGIIAGYSDNTTFINLTVSGTVDGDTDGSAGGIVGFMDNGSKIDNSSSSAVVYGDSAGGLAGYAYNSTLTNATSSGEVYGDYTSGGLVGTLDNGSAIDNSSSSAIVNGGNAGGLAGLMNDNSYIKRSASSAIVTGYGVAGGVAGGIEADSYIRVSSSSATVYGQTAGGIAGYADNGEITDSYSTGSVYGNDPDFNELGGIVGSLTDGSVRNCYASGDVYDNDSATVSSELGGISGNFSANTFTSDMLTGNVAANAQLLGDSNNGTVGRVIGYYDTNSMAISDNYALIDMICTGYYDDVGDNGTNASAAELTSQNFYIGIGWGFDGANDATPWKQNAAVNGGYPYLYWEEQP